MILPAESARLEQGRRPPAAGRSVTVARARELCPELAAWPDGDLMVLLESFYELAPVAVALARQADQSLEVGR